MNRITNAEALALLQSGDLIALGKRADEMRRRFHPDNVVSYIIDRNINYTNICVSGCLFCAFFRTAKSDEGYILPYEEIKQKIHETKELGGIQILMQGGLHPAWKIGDYENLLRRIKADFDIHLHAFSPPEIRHIAALSGLSTEETIRRLKEAGLDSIPGGGAEILVDRVRNRLSPNKCSAAEWLEVMRTAHKLGLKTTATMMFGHIETLEERVEHLEKLRELQDETGGFTAFIPWPFQPDNTPLKNKGIRKKIGALDYIRTLAVSRIFLDNIPNIQASWVTQGSKVAQMALFFGANDMGSTMIEENVVKAAGVSFRLGEKDIRRLVRDAGFIPRRRAQDYALLPEPAGV
ncbi:MAG: dehypoxanthine futalosine cyclase [Nitrospinae bacterium]|nr:dehypoxanthine futalosine cyclase [Nitrospinota bacterium]